MRASHSPPTSATAVTLHSCAVCSKSFVHLHGLKIHRLKHHETKEALFELCGSQFTNNQNLRSHKYKMHTSNISMPVTLQFEGNQQNPTSAPHAEKIYKHAFNLKRHKTRHSLEVTPPPTLKNVCHICDKQFLYPADLAKHCLVHYGEHKFFCIFCKKSYVNNFSFRRHLFTKHGMQDIF
ncbi:hypothetical protein T265_12249 [Opisthorchis viverrini]|uniref:C2H2-type domain-containing protein n=1 Tax=Opisthorchis viverrini TaxID=6198 RepID=A0A074YUY4_OPIVI|nr:hypothetical protein T265_12249 [Opisthorchis viverrini]KER18513.1 hypothetical protein T265_12249 [Opisthorchis viverrini]